MECVTSAFRLCQAQCAETEQTQRPKSDAEAAQADPASDIGRSVLVEHEAHELMRHEHRDVREE